MALVEAARFHTLSEAEVAASLLRSAGIETSIADAHYGSVFWMTQSALGGYRLSIAEQDLRDAVELLRTPAPSQDEGDDEEDPPTPPMSGGQRVAAAALGLVDPTFGWLATSRGVGASFGERTSAALLTMLTVAVVGAVALTGLGLVLAILFELLTNPP